jgi:hypothetical protein
MAHQTKSDLLEMFVDRTAGESTMFNRLITRETDGGNVALIAYGWLKLAVYDESREAVTVFTGHKSLNSKTVARYLNDVVSKAEERGRDVIITGESPTVDQPNGTTHYINNYISMKGNDSAVERDARNAVIESLSAL